MKLSGIKKILALVLALTSLFACAFAEDDAKVVATYKGGEVTKGEAASDLAAEISMMNTTMSYYAQLYGETYTMSEQDLNDIREYVVTAYAKYEILLNKMTELGISDLTEEEKSNLRQNAEYYYLQYIYSFMQQGLTADEAAYYMDMQGMSIDAIYSNSYKNAVQTKIANALEINEVVTDEDIAAEYEALCSDYETTYATAPSTVESYANNGSTVYYMPENMKYIKHIILIPDDEALMTEYNTLVAELTAYESEYATITSSAYEAKYEAIVEKAIKEECLENIEITKKAIEALQGKVYEAVKPVAEEILLAIENGESFDSLIEAYSEDEGSTVEPIKSKGYLVYKDSTIWDGAFIDAANALENVGDVSEPVVGYLGVYIVKYDSQPAAGKIALEDVKDDVISSILFDRRSAVFTEHSEKWFEEADIQLHLEAYE